MAETRKGGRPKILTPCPFCLQEFGAAELRAHIPACPERGARGPVKVAQQPVKEIRYEPLEES